MSYTLSGRVQSRLAAAAPALVVALALQRWWAIELVAVMLAIGLVLDAAVYHRALAYQPAWAALPLGALELGLTYGAMRLLWEMPPPLWEALVLFAVAWVSGQAFGHALFPRLRLDYAEAGGELGRPGALTAAAVALTLAGGLGAAYAVRPPTVHLHGVVQGPLVITRSEKLVGGVVRGGIVVHANHVTISHVSVVGGDYGINVEHVEHVTLDHVRVVRSRLDGIRAYDAGVMIHDCSVSAPAGPLVTGILISYSIGRPMSMVSGGHVSGTREGIATHSSAVDVMDNHVADTEVRGILLGEMSMAMASGNDVEGARGIGISCMDHSMCEIKHNTVAGTRVGSAQDPSAGGVAIESYYYGEATVKHNTIVASPGGVRAFDNSIIERG
jgi:hypothetical protein